LYGESGSVHLLFNDNQAAIQIWQNELPTKKSRHFSLRLAYIKEHIKNIWFVPTDYNKADLQTKALTSAHYKLQFFTAPFDSNKFYKSINKRRKEETCERKITLSSLSTYINYNWKVKVIYTPHTLVGHKNIPSVESVTPTTARVMYYNGTSRKYNRVVYRSNFQC
jgi:hypothetical protein